MVYRKVQATSTAAGLSVWISSDIQALLEYLVGAHLGWPEDATQAAARVGTAVLSAVAVYGIGWLTRERAMVAGRGGGK